MPTAARMLLYLEAITAPAIDLADRVLVIRSGSLLLLDALLTKPKTKIQTKADINIQ